MIRTKILNYFISRFLIKGVKNRAIAEIIKLMPPLMNVATYDPVMSLKKADNSGPHTAPTPIVNDTSP